MKMILITGRTRKQGIGLVRGKPGEDYCREIEQVELASDDMELLKLQEGDRVLVKSGCASVTGVARKSAALLPGMVFIPLGPLANRLIDDCTGGTGMPDYKGLPVEVRPA